jgi:hypothetical protein
VRGAALQALIGNTPQCPRDFGEREYLRRAFETPAESFPSLGLGTDVRFETDEMAGAALEIDSEIIHLFACPRAKPL